MIPARTPDEAEGWYVGREALTRKGENPTECRWEPRGRPVRPAEHHQLATVAVPWMDQRWTFCLKCDGPLPEMWRTMFLDKET